MRKIALTIIALLIVCGTSINAMSYEQARRQALFLTDKMAYELNLNEAQYEAAYEINLDYLMNVNTIDDVYGIYWAHRNTDLSYILYDWQYRAYIEATYFYRPLRWDAGYWRFGIYARYPRRDYYYFGRPSFYNVYNGAHSWRVNGGRSWYNGRELFYGREYNSEYGMRDYYLRGDYDRGADYYNNSPTYQNDRPRSFGNQQRGNFDRSRYNDYYTPRESSTRTTVTRPNNGSSFGGSRSYGNATRTYEPSRSYNAPSSNFGGGSSSFGSSRSNNNNSSNGGSSFGGHR